MPRRARRGRRRTRRTRRRCAPARSTCWRSTCSAAPAASRSGRRALRRGDDRRALCGPRRAPTSTPRRFRRDRRLCAESLRALRQDQADARTARWRIAHPRVAQHVPHECRHHRRGRHAQGAAGALARLEDDPARRPAARPGRGIFHRDADAGRHLRVRRRSPEIRGAGRGRGLRLALARSTTRRCRPTRAASFRSRPISPTACAASSPIRDAWRALPDQVREWLEIQE